MRSINTSIIALLPVLGLLVIRAGMLGVGVLRDLALVQMVGMIAGVISSILLATPLLVDFKMQDPKYREHAKVEQRRSRQRRTGGCRRTPSGIRSPRRPGRDRPSAVRSAGALGSPSKSARAGKRRR